MKEREEAGVAVVGVRVIAAGVVVVVGGVVVVVVAGGANSVLRGSAIERLPRLQALVFICRPIASQCCA